MNILCFIDLGKAFDRYKERRHMDSATEKSEQKHHKR